MLAYLLLDRSQSKADNWTETIFAIGGYVKELAGAAPAAAFTLATFDEPGSPELDAPAHARWFDLIRRPAERHL